MGAKNRDQGEIELSNLRIGISPTSKIDEAVRNGIAGRERSKNRLQPNFLKRFKIVRTFPTALFFSWTALSFGDSSVADNMAQKHLTLDEIVITVRADPETTDTVVGTRIIEQGRNITIPDAIMSEPDIDLKRRTLIGDTTDNLSIRGFSGNRILLNIDSRPVNASGAVGGYYVDWGTIPLDNIEKIELIRGGSSLRYGNNALGGVVNVITKMPTEKPTLTFFGIYGGGEGIYPMQNYRLTHTYKVGPIGYSLAGSYQKADPFLWNNDFEGKNLAASIHADMPFHGIASSGFQYANSRRGFIRTNRMSENPDEPGFNEKLNDNFPLAFGEKFNPYSGSAFIPGPGANWDKTKYYLDFGYSQPIRDALLEIKVYKNFENRKEKNYASGNINNAYIDGELVLDRDVASDRSYGGSLELIKPLGSHELFAGVEHKVLAYGDTDTNYIDMTYNSAPWITLDDLSYKPSSEGVSWGFYVQDTWKISEHWLMTGGLRYDRYKNRSINGNSSPELEDEALAPKFTATYLITDADALTGSVYWALRMPGLPETYWWAEGATGGDPVLRPEKNRAVELLYRHSFSRTNFMRFSAYYYDVDNYIMFRFDPSWRGVYNIDKARIYGASLDGRARFADWVSGNAALTWQKSNKEGDIYDTAGLSNEIDYLPEWKINAGVEFGLPYHSIFNVTARYVGESRTIYAYSGGWPAEQHFKLVELDPYVTTDINLKIPLNESIELGGYVENLFDRKYEEQFGYPMPGIVAGASLKLKILD
jgi:outer membrane receptor protein involved in Fe transport